MSTEINTRLPETINYPDPVVCAPIPDINDTDSASYPVTDGKEIEDVIS